MTTRRVTSRAIIIQDNKLLCVRLTNYRYSTTKDFWCVPGGGVEDGESVLVALNRELIEELGVKPDIGRLLFVQQYKDNTSEQMEFFFHVKNSSDYLDVDLAKTSNGEEEIAEVKFIDPADYFLLPEFLKEISLDIKEDSNSVQFFDYLDRTI